MAHPHRVHRADQAGVKRAHDLFDFDGVIRILQHRTLDGLFPWARDTVAIPRGAVPGRGCDDLIVGDLAVLDDQPVAQHAPWGGDQAITFCGQCLQRVVVELGTALGHAGQAFLYCRQQHGRAYHAGQLTDEHAGTLPLDPADKQRVTGHEQIGQRTGLRRLVVVTRGLGPGVFARVIAVRVGQGAAVEGVAGTGLEKGTGHIFADLLRIQGLEAGRRIDAGGKKRLHVPIRLGQQGAAGTDEAIVAKAGVIQSGGTGQADEQAQFAVAVGRCFGQPVVQFIPGGDILPALDRAAQNLSFVPAPETGQNVAALGDIPATGHRDHPPGNHEGGVRPLAAQDGDDFDELLGGLDGLDGSLAPQGLVACHGGIEKRIVGVRRPGEVRHEEQEEMPEVVLHLFHHQGHVAQVPRTGRYVDMVGHVQGAGRGIQMRRGADAADAGGDHQAVQRPPAVHQVFDAPVHGAHAARRGDNIVPVQFQVDLQIAFHTVQRDDFFHDDQVVLWLPRCRGRQILTDS
ncbi:hypothetical protein DESC_120028 [Desulfosarcina cetonica]|nr:hypothetical protein DESC_120028 [Desulfosarcina cetonica]